MSEKDTFPFPRDQSIYCQVRIEGRTQLATAEMFGLTQARVSQIIRDVARWHAQRGIEPPDEAAARRRRLADHDECQRLRHLYEMTLAELDRQQKPEVERKLGRRGYVEWDEMAYRPPKGRVQLLKLARNLVHDLHEAEQRVRGLLEEEGVGDRESGARNQEPVEEIAEGELSEPIYTSPPENHEPAQEEQATAASAVAASDDAAEPCDAGEIRWSDGHAVYEPPKKYDGINRFDYGISESLPPLTRVLFRGQRAEAEVQEAMKE